MKSVVKSSSFVSIGLRDMCDLLTCKFYKGNKLFILLTTIFPVPRTLPGTQRYAMTTFEQIYF